MSGPTLHTVGEVATRLRVHEKTVRRWLKAGAIGHQRIGPAALVRISEDHVAEFLSAEAAPKALGTATAAPASFRDRARGRGGNDERP